MLGLSFVVLLGCSGVIQTVGQTVVPDYNAKRVINKPTQKDVLISFAPGYPRICANAKTKNGKWYRSVTIFVNLRNQDPAPVSVLINDNIKYLMETDSDIGHSFRYPAGLGTHNIEIWVKSDPLQYFERSLTVRVCGSGNRSSKELSHPWLGT
jgi:hypothetical protein